MGMREYETIFILKPDITDDVSDRVFNRVDKVLTEHNGVLLVRENWGKKRLAYDIAKHTKGTYIFYHYLGDGSLVEELERNFKIDDAVLRYMTVKLDSDVDPEARLSAFKDLEAEPEEEEKSEGASSDAAAEAPAATEAPAAAEAPAVADAPAAAEPAAEAKSASESTEAASESTEAASEKPADNA